ncbi:helix-turn-helix domain-containing protein [Brumimicrobium aurantiacum]|uniref:AraC family transcriptional regulator n=1 Tax=Brumimicrobium aurantiacum TaxID=1737063 RepID=A0A3E1F148_9FLAO|nr:helix-turn-helix domain-containing protein [Brumimicrobium aurantiacum]RFC55469.1 AraC family transcriptional regulator [Brumimicrobium aurantiacum]
MYENIRKTLAFYGIECNQSYYLTFESPLKDSPLKTLPIDFYAFCICTEGEIEVEINQNTFLMKENDFIFAIPSTTIRFKRSSRDFKMNILFFEKNYLIKNLANPFIIEKTVMLNRDTYTIIRGNQKTSIFLTGFLNNIDSKRNEKGRYKDEIIRTMIIHLILEIAELSHSNMNESSKENPNISDVYIQFKSLVVDHILENKTVQFYAQKLNVSNKYLIEIVKKASNKTPHDIINEILIKEAYVLLGNTTLSISQIAYQLHFNSVSSFGRFFKKHTSFSPSAYRLMENLKH